ncbi:DNA polymerase I [Anaerovibrio sp. JC8]|uniref:DNA polymerase I n=1 Tax=Anaerovibrio sp. JC8 TaxID=1240085 RepID=UPI000A0A1803|nr:DNA polymerase I [Anaerovibrio sp. JC8]ORT99775.1 DNA polymerase I [Anaerovibrio sp. JC8]
MKKKFFILDGSSLLYRAFYALPLLESKSGEFTNAIYGFSNMLVKLMTEWKPDYLVIAFDAGKKTFRNDMFTEYKGTRKPTPPELLSQIPIFHEMIKAWGISLVELSGYEADDIIGTLANKALDNGCEAYVVTGDRDALQLVKPDLKVLFTKKGISELKVYDEAAFQEEYEGLDPIQLIDMKGLMGDTSDNIPGVPGVGPKTAMKLLAAYGTVEEVLLHVEEIAGKKLKENIRDNQQMAVLSKKLATICLEVPVDFNEAEYKITTDGNELTRFYTRYNIKSMLKAIQPFITDGEAVAAVPEETIPDCVIINDISTAEKVVEECRQHGKLYASAVIRGKTPDLSIEGLGIAVNGKRFFAEVSTNGEFGQDSLFFDESTADNGLWNVFKELFADESVEKYVHGLKNYYHAGVEVKGKVYDLELIGYLLNPVSSKYDIAELASIYGPSINAPEKNASLCEKESWQAMAMERISADMLEGMKDKELDRLYFDMELPLAEVLADMESNGIYVNRKNLHEQSVAVGKTIAELEKEIHELAGQEFNINSPKQLGEVLFEKLGLPVIKKTKTGYSTNAEVLNQLRHEHPVVEKILSYRLWTKLKSTYLDGISQLINPDTNRVHTNFNQTVTATGRLSSSDPNLQNIPVRTEEGKKIRLLFEPGEGYDYLLSADYSQIELRVLADMSKDESFIKAFKNNEDIHARTAAEVFGISIDEVTQLQRRNAKAVNFGIVYGISDYGLSQDLGITRKEAAGYIESYFEKCKGVKTFIDKVVEDAHAKGYVQTSFGRRRELPSINSSNYMQRMLAERMAMNTPIQGTAADIIKLAMIKAHKMLKDAKLKSRILLQVHDELVLEVVESEIEAVKSILRDAMENIVKLDVPLSIDINMGKNWAEAK